MPEANLPVLGEAATGLTHEPHGYAIGGLAATRTKKDVVHFATIVPAAAGLPAVDKPAARSQETRRQNRHPLIVETQTPDIVEPEIPPAPKQDLRKTWIIAGAATIIALAAAMVGVKALGHASTPVQAANPFGNSAVRRPTAGTITAINGSSLTVKETDFSGSTSTVNVTTSKSTTYHASVDGAVSDLKKGDNVVVTGTTANSVLTATRISQADITLRAPRNGDANGNGGQFFSEGGPPPGAGDTATNGDGGTGRAFGGGNFTAGEIASIDGDTITITDPSGTNTTVKTTDDTKIVVTKTIAFKEFKVGDAVRVTGDASGKTIKATDVTKGGVGGGLFGGPRNRTIVTTPAT